MKGRAPCAIEYVTESRTAGGYAAELTEVRIVSWGPLVHIGLSFFNEPRLGAQAIPPDGGPRSMTYGSVLIEHMGQTWEALAHVERDFVVTLSSVKATCSDGGLRCWEVHGRIVANVPSALLSPYTTPVELTVVF